MKRHKRHHLVTLIALCFVRTAAADTFTVKNTNTNGADSLVQAVADANAHPNIDADTPDIIAFDIPASDPNRDPVTGVFTITPVFPALAPIVDPVILDGYTQGSSTGTTSDDAKPNTLAVGDNAVLLIELNASSTGGVAGVEFRAGSEGSTVRGLIINRCNGCKGVALGAGKIKVFGNFLGTDSTGTVAMGNQWGVNSDGNGGNQIGSPAVADRNLISGNSTGIALANRNSETNTVQNNYIGVNAGGNVALPNTGYGILLSGAFGVGTSGPTLIGGSTSTPGRGAGNVISGNTFDGLNLSASGGSVLGSVTIQGNLIGLGVDGTTAVGNGIGIENVTDFTATLGATLIGGTSATMRNIISGNNGGISYASTNTTVQGNYIGTDVSGTLDRGNATLGLEIVGDHRSSGFPSATDITIGGTVAGAGNLISGNDFGGIWIRNGYATIQGNKIGTQIDGVSALGNSGEGVRVFNVVGDPVLQVAVGGMADGAGNTIAYNGASGVSVEASSVTILRNSIFNNGTTDPGGQFGLGIDIGGGPGVTPNDTGDVDTGPNGYQNFPVLTKVSLGTGDADILGTLDSLASTTYRVEFFGNDAIDPSNYGEGKTFLGSTDVTTDSSGHADFNVSVPALPGVLHVTSTATDPSGNTSEFSTSIGQLLNISTRLRVLTADNVLIGGFILLGPDPKQVIIRAIGPSLSNFGVPGVLADTTLELHAGDGTLIDSNDDWKSDHQAEIEATTIPPTDDLESAIVATLPADGSAYTAIVRGKNGTTGVGLVEAYDLDGAANSQFANISTRGFVDTADNVLIGGFILGGGTAKVIARAIGPSLTDLGVAGALQDPTLELHDGFGTLIASNDNWKTDQQAEIVATGVVPTKDLESAIVATLLPGNYTAIVRGKNDTTGVGLVEIYNLN
jgi:hypothetical protein